MAHRLLPVDTAMRTQAIRSAAPRCAARRAKRQTGVTALEMMVVVAVIGIFAAATVPSFTAWRQDALVRDAAGKVANAFTVARAEAIRTGNRHILVFGNWLAQGPNGVAFAAAMPPGTPPLAALVFNDGPPGANNCQIDAGEVVYTVPADPTLNWGGTAGISNNAAAPNDPNIPPVGVQIGASFRDQNGATINWVLFRPDGIPVTFPLGTCNLAATGSAPGGVYFTNGRRDYAVVLSPLGGIRTHSFDLSVNAWRN